MANRKINNYYDQINHSEVRTQAIILSISQKIIYHLISINALTPKLDTVEDFAKLDLLHTVRRDRRYTRYHLAGFTSGERAELLETAGLTPKEHFIFRLIQAYDAKGEKLPTSTICAGVYARQRKKYSSSHPDHELIATISRIRKSIHNKKAYQVRKELGKDPLGCDENYLGD